MKNLIENQRSFSVGDSVYFKHKKTGFSDFDMLQGKIVNWTLMGDASTCLEIETEDTISNRIRPPKVRKKISVLEVRKFERLDELYEKGVTFRCDEAFQILFASSRTGEFFIAFSKRLSLEERIEACLDYFNPRLKPSP